MRICRLALVGCAVLSTAACGSEPRNYDDCVLKYVKSGMDRAAVAVLMQSCREKFPVRSDTRRLSPDELVRLDGRAGLSYGTHYEGTLYNGNVDVTVSKLQVTITTKVGGASTSKLYTTAVNIPPQSAGTFAFDIVIGDQGADYSWSIASAEGFQKKP